MKTSATQTRCFTLKRIENGESCHSIAAAVNCGKSQISIIRSDRAAILKELESGARYDLKYVKRHVRRVELFLRY